MIYFFSGTGNSRAIAQQLARLTRDKAVFCQEDGACTDGGREEMLGLVFPVYAWGLPKVFNNFIRRLPKTLRRKPAYIYMVCTCGDDIGRTDRLVRRMLRKQGFLLDCAFSVTMPNTYVGLPGFDVDSPDIAERKLREADGKVKEISAIVNSKKKGVWDTTPGKFPGLKTYVLRPLFNRFLTGDRKFSVKNCRQCGACVKACPLHNITLNGKSAPVWKGNCTDCLACYHSCPFHCIEYGCSKGKGQYSYKTSSMGMSHSDTGKESMI